MKVGSNIPFPDHYSATPFSLLTVCQAGPHVRRSRRSGKPYVTPGAEPTYVRSPGQMLSNSSCVRFVLVYQPCTFKTPISIEPGPDFVAVLSSLHSWNWNLPPSKSVRGMFCVFSNIVLQYFQSPNVFADAAQLFQLANSLIKFFLFHKSLEITLWERLKLWLPRIDDLKMVCKSIGGNAWNFDDASSYWWVQRVGEIQNFDPTSSC